MLLLYFSIPVLGQYQEEQQLFIDFQVHASSSSPHKSACLQHESRGQPVRGRAGSK